MVNVIGMGMKKMKYNKIRVTLLGGVGTFINHRYTFFGTIERIDKRRSFTRFHHYIGGIRVSKTKYELRQMWKRIRWTHCEE